MCAVHLYSLNTWWHNEEKETPFFFLPPAPIYKVFTVSCRRRLERRDERATDNYSVIIFFLSADASLHFLKYMLVKISRWRIVVNYFIFLRQLIFSRRWLSIELHALTISLTIFLFAVHHGKSRVENFMRRIATRMCRYVFDISD